MGKIYRRNNLTTNTEPKKKDESRRKRSIILNFRVSPEEKDLINQRIALSGMARGEYFIQSCLHQKITVVGNVRTFEELRGQLERIANRLQEVQQIGELEIEVADALRSVTEILYGERVERKSFENQ